MDEIMQINATPLPFSLDDKIFHCCDEEGKKTWDDLGASMRKKESQLIEKVSNISNE